MEFIVQRLIPVILCLGAVALAWHEMRSPFREGKARLRRIRRMVGSGLLVLMSCMIWAGQLPHVQTLPPEQAMDLLRHWLMVLGLAALLMMFAIWDTLDGVRTLRGYLENVEREEIEKIREHLDGLPTDR